LVTWGTWQALAALRPSTIYSIVLVMFLVTRPARRTLVPRDARPVVAAGTVVCEDR
jgi:hypothetical protein